jgi:hypothetical protein
MGDQTREKNSNWRGGRTITEHGYALIRVGVEHHLADVRGYAYEHRVIGEQILGRRLRRGEEVHHKDDSFAGRSNNDPSNLEVKSSHWEHRKEHRSPGSRLRNPGEPNDEIGCACGCGARFLRYDEQGRPRMFVHGHNPRDTSARDSILAEMVGPIGISELAQRTGSTTAAARQALSKLCRAGEIVRIDKGRYALPSYVGGGGADG